MLSLNWLYNIFLIVSKKIKISINQPLTNNFDAESQEIQLNLINNFNGAKALILFFGNDKCHF